MSDKLQKDLQQVILCDMCTEEDRKPARKTCMKCEISMCVQHLQAHLTTPVLLQTHPLTEPTSACGTSKCPQHGKLLEYYCLDDMTSVCVSCAIEDQHRLHNMKTFSTAHKELMEKLNAEQMALVVKTGGKNLCLENWEKNEREKLSRSSVSLIDAVTQLRDRVLTSVQSSVSARTVAIKTSQSSMQAAQTEEDMFRFLQMYSQVHQDLHKAKAVDLKEGLEPGSERDKLVQEIRQNGEQILDKAEQFLGSLLTVVDPENHQELFATNSDLIFETKMSDPSVSLSKDKRKVFYNSSAGQCSATLMIRTTQSDPNQSTVHRPDHHRWTVSFSEEFDWIVGLRVETCGPVYSLCCKDNQLSYNETLYDDQPVSAFGLLKQGVTRVVPSTSVGQQWRNGHEVGSKPQMVEVLVNLTTSSLSFFRRTGRHQREEIITMKIDNSHSLDPFVQLMLNSTQLNAQTSTFGGIKGLYGHQQHNYNITEVACELI